MSALPQEVVVGPLVVAAALVVGGYLVAILDGVAASLVAGRRPRSALAGPLRGMALLVSRPSARTERPDPALERVALTAYVTVAAVGLAVVPLWRGGAVADVDVGIVVWGAVEAVGVAAVFLRGWAPNSIQALMGGYRFVAVGFSYLLLSMFVLIGAALPARSLRLGAIVESQGSLWNVVRQPLGLPLFLVVALGAVLWSPMGLGVGADLSGGTGVEASGAEHASWHVARAMMALSFSAAAATFFLGGWQGPWLPGMAWMAIKTAAVVVLLVAARHSLARARAERVVVVAWTVLLPLGFVDLVVAGFGALA